MESFQTRKQSMKIYLNGDSHTAGAELLKDYCFAKDDPQYLHMGELAHPRCLELSYGAKLSRTLNAGYNCDAISASSNARILRTTKRFISEKRPETIIIIGWSTWEREEWFYNDWHYQVTASGTDSVPDKLVDKYKQWVNEQTREELIKKQKYWHEQIYLLHKELLERDIKHVFFNSYSHFDSVDPVDWNDCYIDPYTQAGTFWHWCSAQGFTTVNNGYHYGEDAHTAWAQHLLPRLTTVENASNIVRVKKAKINTVLRVNR